MVEGRREGGSKAVAASFPQEADERQQKRNRAMQPPTPALAEGISGQEPAQPRARIGFADRHDREEPIRAPRGSELNCRGVRGGQCMPRTHRQRYAGNGPEEEVEEVEAAVGGASEHVHG